MLEGTNVVVGVVAIAGRSWCCYILEELVLLHSGGVVVVRGNEKNI
jgi:hypothetical protein